MIPALRWTCLVMALTAATCHPVSVFNTATTASGTVANPGSSVSIVFSDFQAYNLFDEPSLTAQGINRNNVNSVATALFNIQVEDPPAEQDLTFLSSLKFYIETADQPPLLIASRDSFTPGLNYAALTVDKTDLMEYFSQPSVNITAQATIANVSTPITLVAVPSFKITVTPTDTFCMN